MDICSYGYQRALFMCCGRSFIRMVSYFGLRLFQGTSLVNQTSFISLLSSCTICCGALRQSFWVLHLLTSCLVCLNSCLYNVPFFLSLNIWLLRIISLRYTPGTNVRLKLYGRDLLSSIPFRLVSYNNYSYLIKIEKLITITMKKIFFTRILYINL